MRLIFINVAIFLIIRIIGVFFDLGEMLPETYLNKYVNPVFGLHTTPESFITNPWALFTNMFAHYDFLHLLFNMIFLYFAGRMFEQMFDNKRLLYTYLLGGLFGGVLEILAHTILPKMGIFNNVVIGASGSITAIFVAIAFYRPNLKVNLFGIFPVRIIILAGLYILKDLLSLGKDDHIAHFAHLGGAILGMISIQSLHSSGNIVNRAQQFGDWLVSLFSGKRKPKMKVKREKQQAGKRPMTDEEYNAVKKKKQDQIDRILDKISKSGYESLTKKEKDFLFNQSKK